VEIEGNRIAGTIRLIKALGGGWSDSLYFQAITATTFCAIGCPHCADACRKTVDFSERHTPRVFLSGFEIVLVI